VARDTPDFYASQNFDKRLPNEPVYEGVVFFRISSCCSLQLSQLLHRAALVGGWWVGQRGLPCALACREQTTECVAEEMRSAGGRVLKSAAENVYQRTKSEMLKSFSILVVAFVLLTATVVAIPLHSTESEAAVADPVDLQYTGSSVETNHENEDVVKSEDDDVDDMELTDDDSDDVEDEEALKLKGIFDMFKGKIWGNFCGIKCTSHFTHSVYDFFRCVAYIEL
jgi:hypothetical protein